MANRPDQKPENISLSTEIGLEGELRNHGATFKPIGVPVGAKLFDVFLQNPEDEAYLWDRACLGATVGRYGLKHATGRWQANDEVAAALFKALSSQAW